MSLTDWLQWAAIISVNIGVYWHMKSKDAHPDMRRETSRKQAKAYGIGKVNDKVYCSNCGRPLLYDESHSCIRQTLDS